MEPDAQSDQGSIYRDQKERARAYPGQLDYGAPPRRPERQPRYASEYRQPELRNWPMVANERSIWVNAKGTARPAPIPKSSTMETSIGRLGAAGRIGTCGGSTMRNWIFSVFVSAALAICSGFAPRHQFLIISLQDRIVAVEILRLHQHARCRSGDFFDPLLFGLSLVEAPLHGGQRRLGIDQPDFDLFIDRVGDLSLRRAAAGFSCRRRRLSLPRPRICAICFRAAFTSGWSSVYFSNKLSRLRWTSCRRSSIGASRPPLTMICGPRSTLSVGGTAASSFCSASRLVTVSARSSFRRLPRRALGRAG